MGNILFSILQSLLFTNSLSFFTWVNLESVCLIYYLNNFALQKSQAKEVGFHVRSHKKMVLQTLSLTLVNSNFAQSDVSLKFLNFYLIGVYL